MLNNKPVPSKTRSFLMNSQCGFFNKIPFVCCSEDYADEITTTTEVLRQSTESVRETTTATLSEKDPEWLIKLKGLVPAPPRCGFEAEDRIIGGEETEITEHIWTVLLEYLKRKCFLN